MSGFISSPPAPRRRLRLSRSAGSFHITGLPVSSFVSFLSLSFLSFESWPFAAKGRANIRTSKQTDQNADLVRNMLNTSPACSFLVQTLWPRDYKARNQPQIIAFSVADGFALKSETERQRCG